MRRIGWQDAAKSAVVVAVPRPEEVREPSAAEESEQEEAARLVRRGPPASSRTELVIGQARDKAQVASILRQTETGKAGFIASSKNKTRKLTRVLTESDVYLS